MLNLRPDLSGALFLFSQKRKKREPFVKLRINYRRIKAPKVFYNSPFPADVESLSEAPFGFIVLLNLSNSKGKFSNKPDNDNAE